MDLSISIISTNEKHYLDVLLPQIPIVSEGVEFEVIIIDNNSSDGTSDLEKDYSFVRVIRNNKKEYFCWNHNLGIKESLGKYILLLNPDICFDTSEACLTKMVRFMESEPECGISGCRVYNYNNEFAYPARMYQTFSMITGRRIPFLASKVVMDRYLYKDADIYSTFESDWLSGCFLFMRKEMFEKTGYLDTGFKKYFEDVDICFRAWSAGWKVIYYGGTFYYHLEQRASKRFFSKDAMMHVMSWFRWLNKKRKYPKKN